MRPSPAAFGLLALVACTGARPPDAPAEPTDAAPAVQPHDPTVKRDFPDPLPARDFTMPQAEARTLSNGLKVVVAPNDEVPLVNVTVAFNVGGFADESPGQADVVFDMLNEGAGDLSAEDISKQLKKLASDLSTRGGADGGSVSISTLKRNLAPTLDLMALVLEEPTFPQDEWDILRKRYVAAVAQARKDPNRIASRVQGRLVWGDAYKGRIEMESDYEGLTVDSMKKWWAKYGGPQNAIVLVGGATTADEIVPLLEERLGDWKPDGIESPSVTPVPRPPETSTLYLVDKPGAAQSVVRVMNVVGTRTEPDWFQYDMGLDVLGGTFMSRLNMNLREDKAYTYGARCYTMNGYGPGIASCGASVKTDVTGPSLDEIRKELTRIRGDGVITEEEVVYMRDTTVNGYPKRFETPGAMLGEQVAIWRYGLPEDWPSTYLDKVKAVTRDQAQAALEERWNPDTEVWLVVGDKSVIGKDLEAFGLPIVEIDADGNPVGG